MALEWVIPIVIIFIFGMIGWFAIKTFAIDQSDKNIDDDEENKDNI